MKKPLLMMRIKGLLGPVMGKHCSVPGLSKSAGNAIQRGISGNVVTYQGQTVTYQGDEVTNNA